MKKHYSCLPFQRMDALHMLVFFSFYAVGNLPERMGPKSLFFSLFANGGSKILLAYFLYFAPLEPFRVAFYVLNVTMALAVAFALYADNYAQFFERTDLAQSVFLADLFAFGLPFADLPRFLWGFFIPYLMSNVILCTVGSLRAKECGPRNVYIENFYNFFHENKISAISLSMAILFLFGVPPLHGILWRMEFVKVIYNSGRPLSLAAFIICFCSIGYVYFKWLLAIFQKKPSDKNAVRQPSTLGTDAFIFLCASIVVASAFFTRN